MAAVPDVIVTREQLSPNEVFDTLVNGDENSEITGFIDEVFTTRTVSNGKYRLKKFVLSNGERRIQVLIWGPQIPDFDEITQNTRTVLQVDGILAKETVTNFWREDQNLVTSELHVQDHTHMIALGVFPNDNQQPLPADRQPQAVTFQTLATVDEGTLITISGAIRQQFRTILTPGRGTRYGSALMTNGECKTCVVVNNFSAEDQVTMQAYEIGDGITVIGTVRIEANNRLIKIICDNIGRISTNPEAQLLVEEVRTGIRPLLHINNQ